MRTLHTGIDGTSMPSFALLDVRDPESKDKETDLEAAVSYVIHLSIRGVVEKQPACRDRRRRRLRATRTEATRPKFTTR